MKGAHVELVPVQRRVAHKNAQWKSLSRPERGSGVYRLQTQAMRGWGHGSSRSAVKVRDIRSCLIKGRLLEPGKFLVHNADEVVKLGECGYATYEWVCGARTCTRTT